MNRLPIHGFVYGDSPLHRLNARIKIIGLLLLLTGMAAVSTGAGYLLALEIVLLLVYLSALPPLQILSSLRRIWLFCLLIFLMNAIFFDSAAPLWSGWIFSFSAEGIRQGISVVARVLLAVVLACLLTATTSPMEITGALTSLLYPLQWLRVPVEDVAMIISVAMQFVPLLWEEADNIRKAQTARGARFESRRLRERAASVVPLVVPIFIAAFRRADELAAAMEARGYRKARGYSINTVPLHRRDYAALAAVLVLCLFQLTIL